MNILKRISYFIFATVFFISTMPGTTRIYADESSQVGTEIICPKRTGLKVKKIKSRGDRQLAGVLENKLESYGLEPATLPLKVDYSQSEFLPPVGEQNEQSCVGWSTGYYLRTYQQAKDMGWKVKESDSAINSHVFSPTFIYNQINNDEDYGATLSDAAELLKGTGSATLEKFPYVPFDYLTKPNQDVILSAYPNRVSEWRILYTDIDTNDYIIQKTKEYLNIGDLVVAGSKIGDKFIKPYLNKSGQSIITSESYLPYSHAYVIVGYDDKFATSDGYGAFKLVNSWGKEWGEAGFSFISYKAFAEDAIEGYVFTDLVNTTKEELKVDLSDNVTFNVDFSGNGRYDIKIKGENDNLIYEENNLQGKEGLNSIMWNGKDHTGNKVSDGNYTLSIIPYNNNIPKDAFKLSFIKAGKIKAAKSSAYIYNSIVQYVDIPITFKADGLLNIKISYGDKTYDIVTNQAVKAGESKVYKIDNNEFDFNKKELNKVVIQINVI